MQDGQRALQTEQTSGGGIEISRLGLELGTKEWDILCLVIAFYLLYICWHTTGFYGVYEVFCLSIGLILPPRPSISLLAIICNLI